MQLFFIDDSGSVPPQARLSNQHFVLGGLIIPEEKWHNLESEFFQICDNFKVNGEIKWRFFGQKIGREDKENTLSHLSILERDELRKILLSTAIKDPSIKIITSLDILNMATIDGTS